MSKEKSRVHYSMWNKSQCEEVIGAVYKVLEETGCSVRNERARKMLEGAGCSVNDDLVKIPPSLMKWAIEAAPSEFTLYDRDGNPAMHFAPENTYFGPPITTVFVKDPKTGEKRKGRRSDAANAGMICDALPNIAWASAMSGIEEGNSKLIDVYEVAALLPNTKKPLMYWASSLKNLQYEFELFEAAVGGAQRLKEKPFTICLTCPMDPLVHEGNSIEQIIYLAEREAPVIYIPGVSIGCTSPITIAGSVVVGIADTLVGLLISQLTHKGAPFVISRFSDNLDMKTMTIARTHPEHVMSHAAASSVFKYLGLPFSCNLGDTDSGRVDQIGVFDLVNQLYTGALSGCNMTMSIGGCESCLLTDYAFTVFGNEVIGFVRNLVGGVEISEETLALESIDEVGPGGNFITEEDTIEHIRDFWTTDLLVPTTYGAWLDSGKKDFVEVLNERVNEIIDAGPQNPLSDEILKKLNAIMDRIETENA